MRSFPIANRQISMSILVRFALALGFVCGVVTLTLYCMNPPPAAGEGAAATEFSSARALKHLAVIAQRPHPAGSVEHQVVFDYLVQEVSRLHGSPEVQTAPAPGDEEHPSQLQNIIARLKGSDSGGRALMLVAHYDSVPNSPGASDDGSGVVTLLETLRALKAAPPLKNDVIFLFTDGEELGTLGARSFVEGHPWAKDVGLVLNFEARGSSGPVFMFETSKSNGTLIREFARVAPRPFANSLMSEFYKLSGNDTDLTVFKSARLGGLNFAYVGSAWNYHSARDNVSNIDERSIQHQGTYALALARHFGNFDLRNIEAPDVIYFDVLGRKVFSYGQTWNLVLTVLLILLAAGVSALGFRSGDLSFSGLVLGMVLFIANIVSALIVVTLLPLSRVGPTAVYYFWVLTIVTASIVLTTSVLARRRVKVDERSSGALLVLMLITAVVNLALPGGSFLLTWPLLFSLIALGASFLFKGRFPSSIVAVALVAVCSVPGTVLFTQMLHNVFQGFGMGSPYLLAILELLLLGLLMPFLKYFCHD